MFGTDQAIALRALLRLVADADFPKLPWHCRCLMPPAQTMLDPGSIARHS